MALCKRLEANGDRKTAYILAKVFSLVVKPSNLIVFALLAGTAAYGLRLRRLARALLGSAFVCLFLVTLLPVGNWLITPLENRFEKRAPANVDGIIVLSGAVDPTVSVSRGELSFNAAADRYIAALLLAKKFPQAKVVFAGGESRIFSDQAGGNLATRLVEELGLSPERLVFEDQSRTTYENGVFADRLIERAPNDEWLLVTSAHHMPRAIGVFRQLGWNISPYPVDYRSVGDYTLGLHFYVSAGSRLDKLDTAANEWIGLVAYRLLGRTDTLFPAPSPEWQSGAEASAGRPDSRGYRGSGLNVSKALASTSGQWLR